MMTAADFAIEANLKGLRALSYQDRVALGLQMRRASQTGVLAMKLGILAIILAVALQGTPPQQPKAPPKSRPPATAKAPPKSAPPKSVRPASRPPTKPVGEPKLKRRKPPEG
jgi:hypothetical protein